MRAGTDSRQRILTEARRLFAERGYQAAPTLEIARRAGVSEALLYKYYRDKKELLLACVLPAEQAEDSLPIDAATDLRGLIRATLEVRLRMLARELDSFKILFTVAPHDPELAESIRGQMWPIHRAKVIAAFQRMVAAGQIRRLPGPMVLGIGVTVILWAFLTSSTLAEALQAPLPLPSSEEELINSLTDFILLGMAGELPPA